MWTGITIKGNDINYLATVTMRSDGLFLHVNVRDVVNLESRYCINSPEKKSLSVIL